jgi:phosphatidylethanolamine/phosphatidyl-N-methylethanolamine N-methyltransferase
LREVQSRAAVPIIGRMFRDHIEFFRQFRAQFQTTGSIVPSSRHLARAMTRQIAGPRESARILEVGPGTGAVTRRILKLLQKDDRFDLVELNESFANLLRERFQKDPVFQPAAGQAHVHVCGIETFESDTPYDFIVSGLPFANFSAPFVDQLLNAMFSLLAPGGQLTYFEYMYVRPLRKIVSGQSERNRLTDLDRVLNAFLARHRTSRDSVLLNVPPAWVQHLRKEPIA